MSCVHKILNQKLHLLPEKAIYWEEQNAILIADLHLGKITHFRKSGIAVPSGPEHKNWKVLINLIQSYNPNKILILGDLFHSSYNEEWNTFLEVIQIFTEIEWILIKGNHDILSQDKYDTSDLIVYNEKLDLGPFSLIHEPLDEKDINEDSKYVICGHIHPAIRLQGTGRQSARLPCFYFSENQAILPAFGAFTGMYTIQPKEQDDVFLVVQNKVLNASEMFV